MTERLPRDGTRLAERRFGYMKRELRGKRMDSGGIARQGRLEVSGGGFDPAVKVCLQVVLLIALGYFEMR